MSWETCSSNASQNSVDSDMTFCEELEKTNRVLRKRNSIKYSESYFNSQAQIKKLSLKYITDENKNYKYILQDCIFKIRNHLNKIRIMTMDEIQSLVNDLNKLNTPNKENTAMKGKVLSQLRSLFEETVEIEQRFSSLNINNSQVINTIQDYCLKSHQDVAVNDTQNTIISNKTNGEQLETSYSYNFINTGEVNNCTQSSVIDTIQKDLNKLKEIEKFKNQDPIAKYFEEILQKSSTVSFSFDENMLSNADFKTPSLKAPLHTQIKSDDIIMNFTQSEKSEIFHGTDDNINILPKDMSFDDIIPSSIIENKHKKVQVKTMLTTLPNNNVPSTGTSCEIISKNTIPSTFSQELKVDNCLTTTNYDSNEYDQSFPIEMLTNNLFENPSVKLCKSLQISCKDENSKFCSDDYLKFDYNYSTIMPILPCSDENNGNLLLKLDGNNNEHLKSKNISSPILRKKLNYKTQSYKYTKYSRKYKSKNISNKIKRLTPSNNINTVQQICIVPSQIKIYPQAQQFDDRNEFNTVKGNENIQSLNCNITPNSTDIDLINNNGLAATANRGTLEFATNENPTSSDISEEPELQTLKVVIEKVDKFKKEFAKWILQIAMDECSRKSNSNYIAENIQEEKDITDLNFQLTAQEKNQNYSKINEIANFYREKLRIEGLPKFDDFPKKPFCVNFDEIDKKYQQRK